MITLHLLQYLLENGFGTALDEDLFWEKLPLDKTGVAIFSRGDPRSYGDRSDAQRFDLYCRGTSDLVGGDTLDKIGGFLTDNYDKVCELPLVPNLSNRQYERVRIGDVGNIENIGLDENDRLIFRMGAQVIYKKVN